MQHGWTALHHAARNGNVELCKLLVAHDCRPHIPNEVSEGGREGVGGRAERIGGR